MKYDFSTVHIVTHPLVQDKLTRLRQRSTGSNAFRALLEGVGALLAYEALRDAPLHMVDIATPLEKMV